MAQDNQHSTWHPMSLPLRNAPPPLPFEPSQGPEIYPSQMSDKLFDQNFPIPDEFLRTPSGSSVLDTNSILEENGRTYHGYKEGKYHMPNDAPEQDRLDMQHKMISMVLDGRLTCAPMTEVPKHVIDVATGTGIWAIEFAKQNPSSYVIGTDLSQIQPDLHLHNIEFIKEDSEDEWLYSHKFDYIHLRLVCMAFDNPRQVLRHAIDNLNEGGWIEYLDFLPGTFSHDGTHEGTVMERYWNKFSDGLAARGRDPTVTAQYATWLREAGLEEVHEMVFEMPGNTWPNDLKMKRIGQYVYVDMHEAVRGAGWQLFKALGMSVGEIEQFVLDFKRDAANPKFHIFYKMHVVYGRKPFKNAI